MAQVNRHSRRQRGFSLIEVLVAMIILSIGLLALTALQLNSLRATNEARRITSITLSAKEMADRMRANPTQLASYAGTSITQIDSNVQGCEGAAASCTAAQLKDYDVNEWFGGLKEAIGGLVRASIYATTGVPDEYTISIQWDEARNGVLAAATDCDDSYSDTDPDRLGCFKLRFKP